MDLCCGKLLEVKLRSMRVLYSIKKLHAQVKQHMLPLARFLCLRPSLLRMTTA